MEDATGVDEGLEYMGQTGWVLEWVVGAALGYRLSCNSCPWNEAPLHITEGSATRYRIEKLAYKEFGKPGANLENVPKENPVNQVQTSLSPEKILQSATVF